MSLLKGIKEINIPEQSKTSQGVFPKVFGPQDGQSSHIVLQQQILRNKAELIEQINKHGAVLFRDFDIQSPNEAASILNQFSFGSFKYVAGAAVRTLVVGSADRSDINTDSVEMFTTNQAPADKPIPFHNELLQTSTYPDFISFYCSSEAQTGGATPILSCSQMYLYIKEKHPEYLKKLEDLGVMYIRVVGAEDNLESPIGRGWKNMFQVQEKDEAEQKMKAQGFSFEWLEGGDCIISSPKLKGLAKSVSGQETFANQILAVFKGWIDNKNSPQKCLKFGDGSAMPLEVLSDLNEYAKKIQVSIPWKSGDLIIIDNLMAMHARQPFTGHKRKIFACLLKGQSERKPQLTQVLNTGYELPLVGFGTWKIAKEQCADVVYKAIKNGYRLFDCACDYGNEKEVGQGLRKAIDEGMVTRKQLFITSKLWNTYHRPENVEKACRKTLQDLGLEYIDLYLMHFPISLKFIPFQERYPPEWVYDPKAKNPCMHQDPVPVTVTWKAMQNLVSNKLVRNIGVSNFRVGLLRELIYSCSIKPAVLQIELHPQLTQKKLLRFCKEQGIQVTSYSTFGASSYIELGMADENDPIFKNQLIINLGKKYGKSPHQIILRWAVQQGVAIIPKSVKQQRMKENFAVQGDFTISVEDMKEIDSLNRNKRYNDPGHFCQLVFGTFFPIHD